jgi:protein O-GlcNAc transferase
VSQTTVTLQQALDIAMEHHREGRLAEAESIYRKLLEVAPDNADVVQLLGLVTYHTGRFPEALQLMERSIAMQPQVARYYINLGPLLIDLGRFAEAAAACETAIRLEPGSSIAFYNLGLAREKLRQFEAAIAAYRQTIALDPAYRLAWLNLGAALNSSGSIEAAIAHYQLALQRFPTDPAVAINLGSLYHDTGRIDTAVALYREALSNDPQNGVARNNLGVALKDLGDLDGSVEVLRGSLALNPQDIVARNNLGNTFKDRGDLDAAVAELRHSLAFSAAAEAHSNLLLTLSYLPTCSPEEMEAERQRWNQLHAVPLRSTRLPHPNDPSPHRRLRLGYVSADFRNHVVGRALWPVFAAHDREQFELVGYSCSQPDAFTTRFRERADLWRSVSDFTDEQLAAQIRADGIDILIDLGQHTAHNRLLALARKPAPVQVNWLGYPAPTGLETMDYRLTDRFLDPPAAEEPACERPVRLPECWCIYDAPSDSPEPGPLPAAAGGGVTFGSFNNFCKINAAVWNVWARVLAAVEGSSLLLLAKSGVHRERSRAELQKRGIAPERLRFAEYRQAPPETSSATWLHRYREIDIALDPFPYNGMTTTCDALWMGVPVVALAGATSLGRASLSLLSNVGLPELVAPSADDYVRIAADLAHDLPRLTALRSTLRARLAASPLLDPPRLARHLEVTFRGLWSRWCETHSCPPVRSL